ncbi:MAG: prepilin peptidase [Acidimicrobiales bacterium]|nr:prepilin peptidase [Acidimicrobiales bacterium]
MSTALLLGFLFLFGLAVGSFCNVAIVRIPSGDSLVHPPSRCPLCETPIAPRDNVPVVSWLLLRGRCRSCGEPIPAGYPVVELTNALLWVLAGVRFGATAPLIPYCLLFSVLLVLSVIDLELYILPNRITYPTIVASAIAIPILSVVAADDPVGSIIRAYLCGIAFAGILLLTTLAYAVVARKDGMGMGDVKLAVILGMWAGWIHPVLPLIALIASSLIGLVIGVGFMVKRGRSDYFPFGPSLAIGTVVVIMFAAPILDFYGFTDDTDAARPVPATAFSEVTFGR